MATTSQFGLSRYQLQELMSQKGKDGQKRLSEYDGVLGIADLLRSNVKGGARRGTARPGVKETGVWR